MTTTSIIRLALVASVWLGASPPDQANPEEPSKRIAWANGPDVLVGLREVNLHIGIRGDVKNPKAGEEYLRTKIEKQLEEAGLAEVTDEEAASSEWPVMLVVIIESRGVQDPKDQDPSTINGGVYLVTVNLDDIVVPCRDDGSVILGATTWSRHRFGFATRSELAAKSMDDALALIEEFCQDIAKASRQR